MCIDCPHNVKKSYCECPFHDAPIRRSWEQVYTINGHDFECEEPERLRIEQKEW